MTQRRDVFRAWSEELHKISGNRSGISGYKYEETKAEIFWLDRTDHSA